MKKNFLARFKGFSLIELLISLIVISVIVASFAPIFSRKIKNHSLSIGGSQTITNDCNSINSDCKICDTTKNTCLYCQGVCNVGYKYNNSTCDCEKLVCASEQYLDGSSCLSCSTKFEHCKNCSISECTKCESGWGIKNGYCKKMQKPKSQSDCNQFKDAIFVKINSDGTGICFTKQNAGDKDGPSADYPGEVNLFGATATTGTVEFGTNLDKICWTGAQSVNTATPSTTDTTYCQETVSGVSYAKTNGSTFDYGACKRTVCNFQAAKYICENYKTEKTKAGDWRLPLSSELKALADIINNQEPSKDGKTGSEKFAAATSKSQIQKYMGAKGLQLCDEMSGYGSPMCRYYKNKCPGSEGIIGNTDCMPASLWGVYTTDKDSVSTFMHLNMGTANPGGIVCVGSTCYINGMHNSNEPESMREKYAFSTRCVLEEFLED